LKGGGERGRRGRAKQQEIELVGEGKEFKTLNLSKKLKGKRI